VLLPLVSPLLAPEQPLRAARSIAPVVRPHQDTPRHSQSSRHSAPVHGSSHSHANAPPRAAAQGTARPLMLPRTGGAAR
jgi:hypothetical protein